MTYAKLPTQHFSKIAPVSWASKVDGNFTALWDDKPNARIYKSTTTSCTTGAYVTIVWSAQRWDVGNCWYSGDASHVVAPQTGLYLFHINTDWAASTTGSRLIICGNKYNP